MKNLFLFFSIVVFTFFFFAQPVFAINKSIRINGGNGYVTLNNSGTGSPLNFSVDSFTLETWINPSAFTGVNNFENTIIGNDSLNGFKGFVLRTGGSRKLEFSYGYGNAWQTLSTTNAVLTANRWTHVAVTKQAGAVSLYVNGQLVRDSLFVTNINITSGSIPLRIGENGSGNNRKFLGNVDEVKIWKTSRTVLQIRDDMAEQCIPYPAELLSYYKLDDTSAVNPSVLISAVNPLYDGMMNDTIVSQGGAYLINGHGTIYVDSSNIYNGCGSQSGNSWSTAFTDLNTAVLLAHAYPFVEKIFVAKGTYVPSMYHFSMLADRTGVMVNVNAYKNKVFHFRMGLQVEGGYPSGGGARNPYVFRTILSAKGVNNNPTDSAYRVVYIDSSANWGQINDTTVLDGLIICNAKCALNAIGYGVNAVYGGALFIKGGTNKIRYCTIENNRGVNNCSGVYAFTGSTLMENCRIQYNTDGRGFCSDQGNYPGTLTMQFDTLANNNNGALRVYYWAAIKNCFFNSNSLPNNYGAGILVQGSVHHIENNVFLNNKVGYPPNQGTGAAIYFEQTVGDTVIGNSFIGNMSGYAGGAVYVFGGTSHYFQDNLFSNDTSTSGGGFYTVNTNTILKGNRFENNYATHGAGFMGNGGNNKLYSNLFKQNIALISGGALRVDGGYDTLIGNAIISNMAGEHGGGLVVGATYAGLYNNNISLNSSGISGGLDLGANTCSVTGNTFYGNSGDSTIFPNYYHAGAIFINGGTNLINNNIFWGNNINTSTNIQGSDYFRWSGTNTFKNNILQLSANNYTMVGNGQFDIGVAAINNLFTLNPQFFNPLDIPGADNLYNTGDDGLRLSTGSPVLDAGDSTLKPATINTDITGALRVTGVNMDMGAYEQTCIPSNVTAPNALSICQGNSTTLIVSAQGLPANILWYADSITMVSLGNGFTFTTPVLMVNDTFWVANNNCFSSIRIPIVVMVNNAMPSLTNVTPINNQNICPGGAAQLNVNSNAPADSLFWYADSLSITVLDTGFVFNTGPLFISDTFWVSAHGCTNTPRIPIAVAVFPNTSTDTTLSNCASYFWPFSGLTYTTSGQYYDTITNIYGCQQIDTLNLTIFPISNNNSSMTACKEYNWPVTNQIYTLSGMYYDTLVNANGCDSILSLNLTILNPNASVAQNLNQLSASPAGAFYQWIKCNPFQLINGATAQNYMAITNADYAVIVTQNGCSDTSACVTVSGVGLVNVGNEPDIYISPNPTIGISTIHFGIMQEDISIRISNAMGQIVSQSQQKHSTFIILDLSPFPDGIYQVEILLERKRFVAKLQKQHP